MKVNKKELEESLNYLTKDNQDSIIFLLQQIQQLPKKEIKDLLRVILFLV